jgi:hypothetical protein
MLEKINEVDEHGGANYLSNELEGGMSRLVDELISTL